jgi:hypothetical protein
VLTAAKTRLLLSFDLAKFSKIGLIFMHGGHVGDQKSTAKAGDSLIKVCNYYSDSI